MTSHPLFHSYLRVLSILVTLGCVVFVGIQFIRPDLPNPPVLADLKAPAAVKEILKNSCYDCHSNETKLLWFDQVVPAYWLVVRDVKEGREHLNFSDFGKLPAAQQKGFLYESVNQIQLGAMPPRSYTLFHPKATITPEQLALLKNYLHPDEANKPADAPQVAAADAEYRKWIAAVPPVREVPPAPNGLAFFPDYKNWKPISTTDRFDNNSLRVILGNEVAIRAIEQNKISPWPDGTVFAKVAWNQMRDETGIVRAGKFWQVEFMVKDARKYASTQGWGFGRWRGDDLVPYGKSPSFTTECTSCHAPMQNNDFVFTMPIKEQEQPSDLFNSEAALPGNLPYQPFDWKVITSSLDKTRRTMSTLFGNDLAVNHARRSPQTSYPPGAILSLVTWRQQEDKHWFGGRIPARVQSIEYVIVKSPVDRNGAYEYEIFEGSPLQKKAAEDLAAAPPRIDAILSQRASVMP